MELLRFYAEHYMGLMHRLDGLEAELNGDELAGEYKNDLTGDPLQLTAERKQEALSVLEFCRSLCKQIGLPLCLKHVDELLSHTSHNLLGRNQVKALKDNVQRELSGRYFVGIPADRHDRFKNGRHNWEDVAKAFPNAIDDIEEMNKCFAVCRYPAAVFHSLLVVEHGLVALGKAIGATDPKEGWDASCNKLAKIVAAGYPANQTGLDFSFLEQLNNCVQTMKFAWRNKVNHATGKPKVMAGGFAPEVTEEIITATRGFMRRLAEGLGL